MNQVAFGLPDPRLIFTHFPIGTDFESIRLNPFNHGSSFVSPVIFLISVMEMIHTNQLNHKNHRSEDELLSETRITRIKGFHGWVAEGILQPLFR